MSVETWTDFEGSRWPVIKSIRRLKFKYPAHAALRRHVFRRDGYRCLRCPAMAINIPADYTGHETLLTTTIMKYGRDVLVLDHVLTLKAGGRSVVENLQTLCETCNKKKIRFDVEDARRYRAQAAA